MNFKFFACGGYFINFLTNLSWKFIPLSKNTNLESLQRAPWGISLRSVREKWSIWLSLSYRGRRAGNVTLWPLGWDSLLCSPFRAGAVVQQLALMPVCQRWCLTDLLLGKKRITPLPVSHSAAGPARLPSFAGLVASLSSKPSKGCHPRSTLSYVGSLKNSHVTSTGRPVARGGDTGVMTPQWNLSPKKYGGGPYFFKKNRLRRAKIDRIIEPIPKNFRLRRAEYFVI